jgi:hypothetical protein
MHSRRQFVIGCTMVAATALIPASALAVPVRRRAALLDQVRFGAFEASVGTTFWVLQEQGPATALELVEARGDSPPVNAFQAAAPDAWNEKFSLIFRGLASQPLTQDTYLFEHGAIGQFGLFIVPIGRRVTAYQRYEAIFNRSIGRTAGVGVAAERGSGFGVDSQPRPNQQPRPVTN